MYLGMYLYDIDTYCTFVASMDGMDHPHGAAWPHVSIYLGMYICMYVYYLYHVYYVYQVRTAPAEPEPEPQPETPPVSSHLGTT